MPFLAIIRSVFMALWAVGSIPCCIYRQDGDCGNGQQRVEQVGALAGFGLLMDES